MEIAQLKKWTEAIYTKLGNMILKIKVHTGYEAED